MDTNFLRKQIREVLYGVLFESSEPKYFIKYSPSYGMYALYKRFRGLDQYDNPNEQIVVVDYLSENPKKAQEMAQKLTGQIIPVNKPTKQKSIKPGEMIMPVSGYKGKRISEIPLEYLIGFIQKNKWMTFVLKDEYLKTIYQYLTKDMAKQTTEYFRKQVTGTSTPDLMTKLKEYKKFENPGGMEKIVFERIVLPLIETELHQRHIRP